MCIEGLRRKIGGVLAMGTDRSTLASLLQFHRGMNKILGTLTTLFIARSPRLRKLAMFMPIAMAVGGYLKKKADQKKAARPRDQWQVEPLSGVHIV